MNIEEVGKKYGTDKITYHGYHRFYEPIFSSLPEKFTLLEIGIEQEKSLCMWQELFPQATIHGIDIKKGFEHAQGTIFKGDQSDKKFLRHIVEDIPTPDVIIDDGSHVPEHQIISFNILFPALIEGGTYIIEDIETSYWREGKLYGNMIRKGYKHPESTIEIFKHIIDRVNTECMANRNYFDTSPIHLDVQEMIGTITFAQNCIIIKKKDKSYEPFDNRPYRFSRTM